MTPKKSKKKLWIIIAIVVVIGIVVVIAAVKGKQNDGIKVSVDPVTKRTIIQTVSANGKIQPETDVKISPYISGEVVELYVKEGDQIRTGDLLAKIDPEIYISVYDQSVASLNTQKANKSNSIARLTQMEAQFENARLSFERQDKLYKQNVISQAEFDQAKANFKVAEAQVISAKQDVKASGYMVKSSEAALKRSRDDLTRTAIFAPSEGTVSKLNVLKGERVTGASQFSSGTEICGWPT